MAGRTDISELCRVALEEQSGWRDTGAEGRRAAYDRFQQLLRSIADLTGRTYEEVMNDAVEEWVILHFCSASDGGLSPEWAAAGAPPAP